MNCILRRSGFRQWSAVLLAVPLLWITLANSADGQQVLRIQNVANGGAADEAKQIKAALQKQKESAERRLMARIDDMNRVCVLSKTQLKKLRIASKGAVVKSMGEYRKQLETMMKQMGQGVAWAALDEQEVEEKDEADDDENQEDEEVVENEAVFQVQMNEIAMVASGMPGTSNTVESQSIWESAVEKVLTTEQSEKYDAHLSKRKEFQRKTAVAGFIAKVDRKLLLSNEQREKLTVIVDKKFGRKLRNQLVTRDQNGGFGVQMFGMAAGGVDGRKSPLKHELLSFLSKSQLSEWKASVEPELQNQFGGFFFGGPVVPGVRVQAAEAIELDDDNTQDDN